MSSNCSGKGEKRNTHATLPNSTFEDKIFKLDSSILGIFWVLIVKNLSKLFMLGLFLEQTIILIKIIIISMSHYFGHSPIFLIILIGIEWCFWKKMVKTIDQFCSCAVYIVKRLIFSKFCKKVENGSFFSKSARYYRFWSKIVVFTVLRLDSAKKCIKNKKIMIHTSSKWSKNGIFSNNAHLVAANGWKFSTFLKKWISWWTIILIKNYHNSNNFFFDLAQLSLSEVQKFLEFRFPLLCINFEHRNCQNLEGILKISWTQKLGFVHNSFNFEFRAISLKFCILSN